MEMCDIVGCDQEADFYNGMGNAFCEDCMEKAINEEEDLTAEDFDMINI